MLLELRVRNFALVEDKTISLQGGMTAFTGETGAGKSLLLNAITLLLGAKAHKDMVRDGQSSALVEGIFNLSSDPDKQRWLEEHGFPVDSDDGNLLVIKREISVQSTGKNRIWIQGMSASRLQLQELLGDWIEISGQHEFLRLNQDHYLLHVLDSFSGSFTKLQSYEESYHRWKSCEKALSDLESQEGFAANFLELKRFQLEELAKAGISESITQDYETLVSHQKLLKARGTLIDRSRRALELIDTPSSNSESGATGALENLEKASFLISDFAQLDPKLRLASELLEQASTLVRDARAHIEESGAALEDDPNALETLETRLSLLNQIKRKFRCEIQDLYPLRKALEAELSDLENYDERLSELRKSLEAARKQAWERALDLHNHRKTHATRLQSLWQKGVRELGIPKATFEISLTLGETLGAEGLTQLELLFSANPGSKPRPIKQVASGGELSRILLALKHIVSSKSEVCAYLFDEIDTGIGGETAQTVGLRLKEIAQDSQVIVVTHLPQVAALAKTHFQIVKKVQGTQTRTEILSLGRKEREQEIARMLGSSKSKAAVSLAKELLLGGTPS